jgi:hypothetical protein
MSFLCFVYCNSKNKVHFFGNYWKAVSLLHFPAGRVGCHCLDLFFKHQENPLSIELCDLSHQGLVGLETLMLPLPPISPSYFGFSDTISYVIAFSLFISVNLTEKIYIPT